MKLQAFIEGIKDLLFPQARCLGCDEPRKITPGEALCQKCSFALEALRIPDSACGHCLSPMKGNSPCGFCAKGRMEGLDQAFAPYVYKDLARKLIVDLKFGPVALAGKPLGREMALCISGIRYDALVPVPLHPVRLRERGMNQALLLCELVHEETGLAVMDVLEKTRKIKRQSRLQAKDREENVKGAIRCRTDLTGKNLLLVDDVRTTGATARECAKALRAAGAVGVSLLTAAIAVVGEDHD